MSRIFFVAGESSGDMHGAALIRALRRMRPEVVCEGLGGPRMAEAGMDLRFDLAGRGIMGFVEVVRSLPLIRRVFRETVAHWRERPPDCVVLVDYPGLNMRLAAEAKRLGLRVVYYISPQVWAWKRRRIRDLAETVDKMLVILPFEQGIYEKAGVPCAFVGHPLLDHIEGFEPRRTFTGDPVIGLLPGSRKQEIARIMPLQAAVARRLVTAYPKARFAAPCVDAEREAQIRRIAGNLPLETAVGGMYDVLYAARFCLVASGTATLEAALFGTPMVIVYRLAPLSYHIAKRFVRVEHIGLVNLLAGRRLAPEFVQGQATVNAVFKAAVERIEDGPVRRETIAGLAKVREKLGAGGASEHAAREVLAAAEGGAHG